MQGQSLLYSKFEASRATLKPSVKEIKREEWGTEGKERGRRRWGRGGEV